MNDPWVIGALFGASLAALLWTLRVVTPSGALVGGALTCLFIAVGGWGTFSGFVLLVVGGSILTRLGEGPASERRRDGYQAVANAGPALVWLLVLEQPAAGIAAAAALGAAWSDTASSELGQRFAARPRMMLLGPPVERGRDGGMSPVGTLVGVGAAGIAAGLAAAFDGVGVVAAIAVGAFAGNLVDSLLGATVESSLPDRCANHIVNGVASLAGGAVAWWWTMGGGA